MPDAPLPLVIFGAGTLAQLARAYFVRDTSHEIEAFTVDRDYLESADMDGLQGVPFEDIERHYPPSECSLFVALGYTGVNRRRADTFQRAVELGYHLPTLVSSRALCWDDLSIGRNCLVFDGVVIEPRVSIGDGVIAWSGSQISHDAVVADHCFLAPHAVVLGNVSVGARSFIGANATVRDGVTIAEDCVVGAGTVIKENTTSGDIYSVERSRPRPGRRSHEDVEL